MTSEQFVGKIKQVVYEAAVQGTLSLIDKPPGRKPSDSLIALSDLFKRLSEKDKKTFRDGIALAAHQATFGMLAVLDGVRQVEDSPRKGSLKLYYIKDGRHVLLNDPKSEALHDLLNQS